MKEDLALSLVARPGDTLVVSFADHLSQADAYQIKQRFHEELPGVKVVLVTRCTGLAVVQGTREVDLDDLEEFPYVTDTPNEAIDSWGPERGRKTATGAVIPRKPTTPPPPPPAPGWSR